MRKIKKRFSQGEIREYLTQYPLWKFNKYLRKVEYHVNNRGYFHYIARIFWKIKLKKVSLKLGWLIPPNSCEAGLCIVHPGTVVINDKARIGKNVRIHVCVNIGGAGNVAPVIGDNVYIGPGAKIYGDIFIGNNVSIGANAVVNKSFGDNVLLFGVPSIAKLKEDKQRED